MKIAIAGAAPAMGRMLIEAVLAADDVQLGAALKSPVIRISARTSASFSVLPAAFACPTKWSRPLRRATC